MAKYLSLYICALLALCLLSCNLSPHNDSESEESEQEDIEGALEFQFMRTADPATHAIPFGKVMQAYTTLKARGYYKNYSDNGSRSSDWHQINDFFPTLSVTKIVYDPINISTYYFCTGEGWYNADAVKGAGIFKSTDAGNTWAQLPATNTATFSYCQDMAIHPTTGDIYVATRTGGLQRSTDGGATWQKILGAGAGAVRNSVCDIEFTADGNVFVGIGIFETDGIYFSASGDSGTFVKQTNGFPSSNVYRIELATAPSNSNVAYAIASNTSDYKIKGIYRTADKGTSWTETNRPDNNYDMAAKQAWYDLSLGVDPNDENTVIAGGLNLWRSKDGGNSWQQLTSGKLDSNLVRYVHVDQHEVVFQNSDTVYFGNDGGIWKCDNMTAPIPFIYDRNSGYNVTQYYDVSINPLAGSPQVTGGTQDNGTSLALSDGLVDFKPVSGGDGAFTAFNSINPDIFYTASQLRPIFRFTNGGFEIPDTITNHYLTASNVLFINPFEINATDPEVLFQASNIGLWRLKNASTADSLSWEKACTISGAITAIATSVNEPDIIFIGKNSSNGEIYKLLFGSTVDGGSTPAGIDPFDQLPNAPFGGAIYCSSITVDVHDANHVLVTYSNYGTQHIFESTNALSADPNWANISGDLPDIPVYSSALHPNNSTVCYIATEMGVFYTDTISGASTQWIPCSSFPLVRTDMLRIRQNDLTIVAGTHGRGIWQAKLTGTATANNVIWTERGPTNVGGRTQAIMIDPNDPTGKSIWAGSVAGGLWHTSNIDLDAIDTPCKPTVQFSIFPNPISQSTTIQFIATGGGYTHIDLVNMQGKHIETILNKQVSGSYSFNWTPSPVLAKGVYLILLQNDKSSAVKKVIIL